MPAPKKVITQKITIDKGKIPKPVEKKDAVVPKPKEAAPIAAKKAAAKSATAATDAAPLKKPTEPVAAVKKSPAESKKKAKAMAGEPGMEAGKSKPEEEKPMEQTISYNPQGKIDPFAPLFSNKPVVATKQETAQGAAGKKKVKKKERRIPRTPLEKMDLGQLKLVAIVRSQSGNRALVQDATGKGYVLNKGTYIGINSGFVTRIASDRVIIEEEVEDLYGKVTLREKEIVLQKPRGDI